MSRSPSWSLANDPGEKARRKAETQYEQFQREIAAGRLDPRTFEPINSRTPPPSRVADPLPHIANAVSPLKKSGIPIEALEKFSPSGMANLHKLADDIAAVAALVDADSPWEMEKLQSLCEQMNAQATDVVNNYRRGQRAHAAIDPSGWGGKW